MQSNKIFLCQNCVTQGFSTQDTDKYTCNGIYRKELRHNMLDAKKKTEFKADPDLARK